MRSTLEAGGTSAVLDRNDGGTQTVREMSEQMSQVCTSYNNSGAAAAVNNSSLCFCVARLVV